MNTDFNILTFESPWAFLGLLYLCFCLVSGGFLLLSTALGKALNVRDRSYTGLFYRLLLTYGLITVGYAVLKTGGASSLVPMLFFGVALMYLTRSSGKQGADKGWIPASGQQTAVYFLFGTGLFVLFSTLLVDFTNGNIRYLHHSEFTPFGVDSAFYVRMGEYLNQCGVESTWADFYSCEELGRTPYHWFELWFAALIYQFFPINSESLWATVVNPNLFLLLIVGAISIAEKVTRSETKAIPSGIIVLLVGTFGFLIPEDTWLVGEFRYSTNILAAIKTVPSYLGAAVVIRVALGEKKELLPILFSLLGLVYLPVFPAAFLTAGLLAVLNLVFSKNKQQWQTTTVWAVATMLTALWFGWFFANSGISYSPGKGLSSGVFEGFQGIEFLKVLIRSFIEMVIPNLPLLPLIIILWKSREKNKSKEKLKRFMLGCAVVFSMSGLAFAVLYKMVDARQVWLVAYTSFHGLLLTALLTYGIASRQWLVRIYSFVLIGLLVTNGHWDLGSGNTTDRHELARLEAFVRNDDERGIRFGHLGSAADTGIEVGGIFKYALHIHCPLKQLGLIYSPYYSANLSALELEREAIGRLGQVEQIMINLSALKRFSVNNNLKLTDEKVVEMFMIQNGITHLIVPEGVTMPERMKQLTGESQVFFNTRVYKVLTLPEQVVM